MTKTVQQTYQVCVKPLLQLRDNIEELTIQTRQWYFLTKSPIFEGLVTIVTFILQILHSFLADTLHIFIDSNDCNQFSFYHLMDFMFALALFYKLIC
jgi:hypothetical protein